jgi:hypothetical protein
VLAENCYERHSAKAKTLKGGLYLDSKAGWEKVCDSGQAVIIPGKPEESLPLRTVLHLKEDSSPLSSGPIRSPIASRDTAEKANAKQ